MQQPEPLADELRAIKAKGFRAFKIGWDLSVKSMRNWTKRLSARRVRRSATTRKLMVDAGASNAFWPHGYKWALRTAEMLADYDVAWFEEPLVRMR